MSENLKLYSKAAKSSLENAEQWIKDAKLLLEHESFGHASALLRIALEETAKAHICWFTSEGMWPIENKVIQDVFRYHKVKNRLFLGLICAAEWMRENYPLEVATKDMLEPTEEEILETFEEFEDMIEAVEKMRQRAMYVDVDLEKKEVSTPMTIGEKEPDIVLKGAEFFLKLTRYYMEKFSEEKKAKVREFFSFIPREAWKTGEIPIEWFRE